MYASISGTTAAVPVASLTDWAYNATTSRTEVTAFGDTSKVYVQGLPDAAGTFSGFWDDTDTTLRQAAASADGCRLYLYTSTNALSKYIYGPAWVDFSVTASVGDAVKISGSFAANGSFTNFS